MKEFLKLSQVNQLIQEGIREFFPYSFWVVAETSDVRISNRHCYLEFIEKNESNQAIVAKARGYIWANTFELLNPYFEEKTGRKFASGMKVLVNVSVEFHPVYGFGLNVCDIDPTYTLGDIAARRDEIIRKLEEEGILHLNKELDFPVLPQRIAIISSPTAAGYEDFQNHLIHNSSGYVFYTHLFPAVMQGEQTEQSIIKALDDIFRNKEKFDVVAIIRGGGASSDLHSFDSYPLAVNCAQFPLPIITGIGHERDDTVLDYISFYRAKTPTAVADFLIDRLDDFSASLEEKREKILSGAKRTLYSARENLSRITHYFPLLSQRLIEYRRSELNILQTHLKNETLRFLAKENAAINQKEVFFKFSSPEYILAKGYSITLKNGKSIKSYQDVATGEVIETIFKDGSIFSEVK